MEQKISEIVGATVLETLKEEENRIDLTLNKLNSIDEDDLEKIREKRLKQLKEKSIQNKEWKAAGHGEYYELTDQQEFFNVTKKSKQVIVHFYSPSNKYCNILDKHLNEIALKHLETRFCKMNAEKAEYLVKKLGIWMMPCLALCKDREVIYLVQGFNEFGGTDKFSKSFLEYYLSQKKVLTYNGLIPESFTDNLDNNRSIKDNYNKNIKQSIYYDSDLE